MKVFWTEEAKLHLRSIHDYIAQRSTEYARRMVSRLTRRSEHLELFPMSGRVVREFGLPQVREVFEGPYRIIYRIKPDQIDVLAVVHGAREDWKREIRDRS